MLLDNAYWRDIVFTTNPKIILTTILDRIKWNSKPCVGGYLPPQNQGWTREENLESRESRALDLMVFVISRLQIKNMREGEGRGKNFQSLLSKNVAWLNSPTSSPGLFPSHFLREKPWGRGCEFTLRESDLKFSFTWLLMTKQTPKVQTSVLTNVLYCWNDVVVVKDLINSRKHTCTYFKCC